METNELKIHPGHKRINQFLERAAFAYTVHNGSVCLKLKTPERDGCDVVQLRYDSDNGYWIESFGKFNDQEGVHIEDSGADVITFLITKS